MTLIDAEQAVSRARAAQAGWGAQSTRQRCAHLAAIRRTIARKAESTAAAIAGETSKPVLDALAGDVLVTLEQMRFYEKHAAHILRPRGAGRPSFLFAGSHFETHFEPHGVALVCSPSNYPFQLAVIPLVTALIAGNAVLLKCSPQTPETAALIVDLCRDAGLPADLVQVFHGGPEQAEAFLDAHVDVIFFTGSSRNGKQVAERAAQHLIPAILELGGKDASLIFADCHLERAVEGTLYGAFSNAGRVCVAVKRAYVEAHVCAGFVRALTERLARLNVASSPDADLCPLPEAAREVHLAHVRDAMSRGAKLCFPSQAELAAGGPVVLLDVPREAQIMTEESFGPALCVGMFHDEEEAIALANATPFALSSSVWTCNRARARRVAAQICAGSCAINDVIRVIANPHTPFGGNRQSGYGRYHGAEGLKAFSRVKTIMFSKDRNARQINWFPFTARTRDQLASFIQLRHGSGFFRSLLRMLSVMLTLASVSNRLPAQMNPETPLSVLVELTPQAHGQLAYLIFGSASGFPSDGRKAVRKGFVPLPASGTQLQIHTTLPPGRYAVSLYEDLNGNHKLDHNFLGIPREPVGASNNPRGRMGPPRFADCLFEIGSDPKAITVHMVSGL